MFISIEEIRSLTSFKGVRDLSDNELERYIERADSWIYRAVNRDYSLTENLFIKNDMKQATLLLVEYLFYWDDPDIRGSMMGPEEGVSLGSYQVNYRSLSEWREAIPGEYTGVKELDNILKSYRFNPSAAFFKVLKK